MNTNQQPHRLNVIIFVLLQNQHLISTRHPISTRPIALLFVSFVLKVANWSQLACCSPMLVHFGSCLESTLCANQEHWSRALKLFHRSPLSSSALFLLFIQLYHLCDAFTRLLSRLLGDTCWLLRNLSCFLKSSWQNIANMGLLFSRIWSYFTHEGMF